MGSFVKVTLSSRSGFFWSGFGSLSINRETSSIRPSLPLLPDHEPEHLYGLVFLFLRTCFLTLERFSSVLDREDVRREAYTLSIPYGRFRQMGRRDPSRCYQGRTSCWPFVLVLSDSSQRTSNRFCLDGPSTVFRTRTSVVTPRLSCSSWWHRYRYLIPQFVWGVLTNPLWIYSLGHLTPSFGIVSG